MRRKRTRGESATSRKALQLCRQVEEVLNQVLSGECGDAVLQELHVVSVSPAPSTSQVVVRIAPVFSDSRLSPAEALARLERAAGMLRSAVAAAITRRRAPRLMFQYVGDLVQ
jgi:ribosome-binding factor A